MPLVRFQVRNEAQPELYDGEDPKAVLDGVAVAGLVGILRQLGDLAEFAGEVFHGLQEQVTTTASRSHKLMVRVQNIEAALPPIEKAIQAQTSHIHFAYTGGLEWHPRIRTEQNHFIYNDLPRFIMDSYEECRDPPRLHLLDRFDTGGPGSCIKRYSDPTFFKRVSTSSNEKNTEKNRKDKKTRKIKKKRSSSLRNGEFSRGTSVYSCSGRMQFASSFGNREASPSQTASTVDRSSKLDPGERSNSFDSRNGLGYIECVFPRGSSVQSEEHEHNSKKASPVSLQHNDNVDSVFSDEHSKVVDDSYLHDSFKEKIAPSSSCVSWEEKEEIVEPKGQQYEEEEDEDQDILLEMSEIDLLNSAAVKPSDADQMDTVFDDENAPASTSDRSELDDIESETDNYLDALNTIESESDIDPDCQTKREVEQDPNVSHRDVEDEISDLHTSTNESDTKSHDFSNNGVPSDLPTAVHSESIIFLENKPVNTEISSNSDHSLEIDVRGNVDTHDESKVDSIISHASPSDTSDYDLQDQPGKTAITCFSGSQEPPTEISGSQSVKLWTNGGLLGLQPSKPPDFAVLNTIREVSLSRSEKETAGPPNHAFTIKDGQNKGKASMLNENDRSIQKSLSSKNPAYGTFGQATSNGKDKEPEDLVNGDSSWHANEGGRAVPSLVSNGNAMSTIPNLENDEKSSLMFGLGQRLLVNGFRRKLALVPDDDKPLSSNSLERIPETTFREQFEREVPRDSPTSSPPLEHMKISFRPVNGFETSKLKLKFPDGSRSLESVEDMFPSFQLVPDSAIPLREARSDSDDDTFCRSSPYMSDDCDSIHSESDSEEWEVGENTGSKDQELYDAFCRVSGSEAVSSSPDLWEAANNADGNHLSIENGKEHYLSGPLLEPPSLNVVNPLYQQETRSDSDPTQPVNPLYQQETGGGSDHTQSDSMPPPLPPVQWRLLKSHSKMEEEPHAVFEAPRLVKPSISQQAQLDPAVQPRTNNVAVGFKPKSEMQDQPKVNGQKEVNQASNGKGVVEREDFLHQIRTQSFNLRRTAPAKPTPVTPTSNISVTAILEKANAIRQSQAVASDDGEEDTWSDT